MKMRGRTHRRLLSAVLAAVLLVSTVLPAAASEGNGSAPYSVPFETVEDETLPARSYTDREAVEQDSAETISVDNSKIVRVSIVLNDPGALKKASSSGLSAAEAAEDVSTIAYRSSLISTQALIQRNIERDVLDGGNLDVVWNLTLAANIISANVPYGAVEKLKSMPGVADVFLETQYKPAVLEQREPANPQMATSSSMIGTSAAWGSGYTGAGSRIAVIDTGIDPEHISFDAGALKYSLEQEASEKGISLEQYISDLDLLDVQELSEKFSSLHISERGSFSADQIYNSLKLPVAFNYVDGDTDISHMNDSEGEHGSHVSGIAAANRFIPDGTGYVSALDKVYVQGVAPDAQLLAMKVFGKSGGAYDSDYMVAIEDAIVLGADAVNLSLGSSSAGFTSMPNAYQDIMDDLTSSGVVVTISAGNTGGWADNTPQKKLYADDVNMDTTGLPGSYTNALTVASADNSGFTGSSFKIGGSSVIYAEGGWNYPPMTVPATMESKKGTHEYILIDGYGTADEVDALGESVLKGKFFVCSRGGDISFQKKFDNPKKYGVQGVIVYDNEPGALITADLSDNFSGKEAAFATVTMAGGRTMKDSAEPVKGADGKVLYYKGTMVIDCSTTVIQENPDFYTMSSFSSWGVPGDLSLKPEITAPGGSIYSVWGANGASGVQDSPTEAHNLYEQMSGTSMSSPQVAGMAAVMAQYVKEKGLEKSTGLSTRQLIQSLLMSTAEPVKENSSTYYPVLRQGAGLANVGNAVSAKSYVLMDGSATASAADGKVKAELGDDPQRTGIYSVSFTLNDLAKDGKDRSYTLSADFFTQSLITEDGYTYMGTSTMPLTADVTWTVDGNVITPRTMDPGMDFDGDGDVDVSDGQALLDLCTGLRTEISNEDHADLDGNKAVDTYDAYLFFKDLQSVKAVLHSGSTTTVTATVKLTEEQKTRLNKEFSNGAYVEGFLTAQADTDEEGTLGDCHSIPVLGFYGSWADPSMFDIGTWTAYYHGTESRSPYLDISGSNYAKMSNNVGIRYKSDPTAIMPFGGNPIEADDVYHPERNAISGVSGDKFAKVYFSLIRNAAAVRLIVKNETTGKVLQTQEEIAQYDAAYYVSEWYKNRHFLMVNYEPNNEEEIKEGDTISFQLTALPEYYVRDGKADWNAAGKGSTMRITGVLDNQNPVITGVKVDESKGEILVTVKDNQYVAGVRLLDRNQNHSRVLSSAKANLEAKKGDSLVFSLPLEDVYGKEFYIEAADYAMNTSMAHVDQKIGKPKALPEVMGFSPESMTWLSFDRTSPSTCQAWSSSMDSSISFWGATMKGKMIVACTDMGNLWLIDGEDPTNVYKVGKLSGPPIEASSYKMGLMPDMAYNAKTDKIYGLLYTERKYKDLWEIAERPLAFPTGREEDTTKLVSVDPYTAKVEEVATLPFSTNTLACDEDGTFYTNSAGTGKVYSFTLPETETVSDADKTISLGQMTEVFKFDDLNIEEEMKEYWKKYDAWNAMTEEEQNKDMMKNPGSPNFCFGLQSMEYDPITKKLGWLGTAHSLGYGGYTWYYIEADLTDKTQESHEFSSPLISCLIYPDNSETNSGWDIDGGTVSSILLSDTELALLQGSSKQLTAEVYPWNLADPSLNWSSDNADIASVDQNGLITANFKGETTIHAVSNAKPDIKADCHVVVNEVNVTLTGTVMDKESLPHFFSWNLADSPSFTITGNIEEEMSIVAGAYDSKSKEAYILDGMTKVHKYDSSGKELACSEACELPVVDMAYSALSTPDHPLVYAIYGTNLLLPTDPMNLNEEHAIDFTEALGPYAEALAAVASAGVNDEGTETVFILDTSGNIWPFQCKPNGDSGSYLISQPEDISKASTNLRKDLALYTDTSSGLYYYSMIAGDDGALYLAAYKEDDETSHLIRIDVTVGKWSTTAYASRLGDFGMNNWPVTLFTAAGNEKGPAAPPTSSRLTEWSSSSKTDKSAGAESSGLNPAGSLTSAGTAASPARSTAVADKEQNTVTIEVIPMDEHSRQVASTNGLIEVEYNPSQLKLESVEVLGDYRSINIGDPGRVAIAYVSLEGVEENSPVARLIFQRVTSTYSPVTLWHRQVNNTHPNLRERVYDPSVHTGGGGSGGSGGSGKPQKPKPDKPEPSPSPQTPAPENFVDLVPGSWYYDDVAAVLKAGLMRGTSENTFAPDMKLGRGMLATILYRMSGEPSVSGTPAFTDVAAGMYYTDPVTWAAENGIVKGISADAFAPDRDITRQELAVMLWRYAQALGYSVAADGTTIPDFSDRNLIAPWAGEAISWAYRSGIMMGVSDTVLNPTGTATRAEACTMVARFMRLQESIKNSSDSSLAES